MRWCRRRPGRRRLRERALALAAQSDRPADAKGIALTPLQRTYSR